VVEAGLDFFLYPATVEFNQLFSGLPPHKHLFLLTFVMVSVAIALKTVALQRKTKEALWEGERLKWGISDPPRQRNFGSNGVFDAPRNILQAIPGIEFAEMERIREFSWCCGAGGGVKSAFPEFALHSAQERIAEASETGAEAVVTSCPWCELNLADGAAASGSALKIVSLVELIEKAL